MIDPKLSEAVRQVIKDTKIEEGVVRPSLGDEKVKEKPKFPQARANNKEMGLLDSIPSLEKSNVEPFGSLDLSIDMIARKTKNPKYEEYISSKKSRFNHPYLLESLQENCRKVLSHSELFQSRFKLIHTLLNNLMDSYPSYFSTLMGQLEEITTLLLAELNFLITKLSSQRVANRQQLVQSCSIENPEDFLEMDFDAKQEEDPKSKETGRVVSLRPDDK